MSLYEQVKQQALKRQKLCYEIKKIIVERLDLDVSPSLLTDDQPLFGRGLKLDSIDSLELVVGVEAAFDVSITDNNMEIFGSVNKIADYIEAETKGECYDTVA